MKIWYFGLTSISRYLGIIIIGIYNIIILNIKPYRWQLEVPSSSIPKTKWLEYITPTVKYNTIPYTYCINILYALLYFICCLRTLFSSQRSASRPCICVYISTRARDVYFMVLVEPIIALRTNNSETLIGKLTKIDSYTHFSGYPAAVLA